MNCLLILCVFLLLPQSLFSEPASSKYKMYDLSNSLKSYMYYLKEEVVNGAVVHKWVASENDAKDKWSIHFGEHELVSAEEILGPDGRNYLRVPYGDKPGQKIQANQETAYFLIPEFPNGKKLDGDKVNEANYQPVIVGTKRLGAYFSKREDSTVYLDLPYHEMIPMTEDPETDTSKCIEGFVGFKCKGWPSSQEALKVVDSKILRKRDPQTGLQSMEHYYLVETEYKRKTCGLNKEMSASEMSKFCPIEKVKSRGWIPAEQANLNFKRDDTVKGEEIFAYTDKQIKQFEIAIKKMDDENCGFKKKYINGLEDFPLLLEQSSRYPFLDGDIGSCLGKDHIQKMKNTNREIEAKFQKLINTERAHEKVDYNKIHDLELQKNKQIFAQIDDLWTNSKTPFDTYLRKYWDKKYNNPNADKYTSITKDQMISIDALARSLYGEMRESKCSGETTSYYKEIARVMLNRSAIIKKRGKAVEKFISADSLAKIGDPSKASIFEILPHIVSSPAQISSWNTNDNNLMTNLCPEPNENKANNRAWDSAKAVAIEVVLNTKTFLEETNSVQSLFYASKIRPYWEDDPRFTKLGKVNIKHILIDAENERVNVYSKSINNPECVKLYRDSDYVDDMKDISGNREHFYSQFLLDVLNNPDHFVMKSGYLSDGTEAYY